MLPGTGAAGKGGEQIVMVLGQKPTKNYSFHVYICVCFLLQNAALRTTLKDCMSVSFSFFAIYSKNLQATNTCDLMQYFFADVPMKNFLL